MFDLLHSKLTGGQFAEYLSAAARDIIAYIGGIKGYRTFEECAADGQLKNLCIRIMEQITEASRRKEGAGGPDPIRVISDALLRAGNVADICQQAADNAARTRDIVLLCKKQGLYPHFMAKFAAAAVYAMVQSGRLSSPDCFAAVFRYGKECQLNYMITEEYEKIFGGSYFIDNARKVGIMSTAYENGFFSEAEYTGCCQCTLKAFYQTHGSFGEREKYLFKSANGLQGGGASCTDSACGSYSACNLVISSFFGRTIDDFYKKNTGPGEKCDKIGRIIHDKFINTYESVNCRDIHLKTFGRLFDFTLPEDVEAFEQLGGHEDKCPAVVGLTSAWLAGALYDEGLF
ncbi:MAG: C-GCAxxG-C-C family protein [Christensenellales bacterium]